MTTANRKLLCEALRVGVYQKEIRFMKKTIMVRLPLDLYDDLCVTALDEGESLSWLVRDAIRKRVVLGISKDERHVTL